MNGPKLRFPISSQSIYEYIRTDSPQYAIAVVDRLTGRSEQLASFPESGQVVAEYQRHDIREVIEYSYRIIYQVDDSAVTVVAVIHGAKPLPHSPPVDH